MTSGGMDAPQRGTTEAALEAQGLKLSWDGAHVVAEDINLCVRPSEVVCLVGRSGCGKTTLLHALAGLTRPVAGRVLLAGEDVTGKPGHVSYMLQKDLLLQHMTIVDNACLPLVLAGVPRVEARARAAELFAQFGLEGTQEMWPSQLSGGMRQRAAFLRTYLMGNDVALLDEPFSALDAITRQELRTWYVHMAAELGIASLVITHDVDEAVSLAARILVLSGKPAEGKPSHIVGEVEVRRPAGDEDFSLTHEYVDCKREVMELLV